MYEKATRALEDLSNLIKSYETTISFLKSEITKLKDEHYKDQEIAHLNELIKSLQESRSSSIIISKSERERIDEVLKNHLKEVHNEDELRKGAIGGHTLEIFETSIGDWIGVKCPICEKVFEVINRIGN